MNCFEDSIRPCYEPEGCQAFLAYILPDAIAARQSDGCSAVVAEWENELIGVLELREFSHISMFFVDPEFQCGGIGRRLLTRAVTLIRKARPELAELTVFAAPRAVEAYRHLGFTADGPETAESGVPLHADAAKTSIKKYNSRLQCSKMLILYGQGSRNLSKTGGCE